jgi:hypothetical protein
VFDLSENGRREGKTDMQCAIGICHLSVHKLDPFTRFSVESLLVTYYPSQCNGEASGVLIRHDI